MCVTWNGEWEKAKEDITAYKVVSKEGDKYISPLPPDQRARQDIGSGTGKVLTYEIGKKTTSKEPGIYLLSQYINFEGPYVCLKVTIPKGTKFRRGKAATKDTNGNEVVFDTINSLAIVVKSVVPRRSTNWITEISTTSADTTTNYIHWSYVTASATDSTTTYTYSQNI